MTYLTTILAALLLGLSSLALAAEPIDVNSASAPELAAYLEGVGPAKADAIVRYRQQHGPFQDRMDLTKVPGIGPKIVDNNSDMIGFGAGPMASGGLANREDAGSVD